MPLPQKKPHYISVSRRTDIPRFYSEDFFAAWANGEITYNGGYGRSYTVSLKPEDVVGYIFWSKDYGLFIKDPRFKRLIATNNAVFHFTINHCPSLEPYVAPIDRRVQTLKTLCDLVGAKRVLWRYDPLCRYQIPGKQAMDNVDGFFRLLSAMERLGISRCYFSFMTPYIKLKNRSIRFLSFTPEEREAIAGKMHLAAQEAGITLLNCCNPEIPERIPQILSAACVDQDLLKQTDRFGRHLPLSEKPTRKGCGCFQSRDIGSYLQKCGHGCLYCYANPSVTRTAP